MIDLIFPDNFILRSIYDGKLDCPKRPNIPENPLVAARLKFEAENQKPSRSRAMSWDIMANHRIAMAGLSFGADTGAGGILHRMNSPLACNKNIATVRLKQIMHTRSRRIDELMICAPLSLGNYKAAISIICTELPKTQNFEFDISVE